MSPVPANRIEVVNEAPISLGGDYVLYWMIAARRMTWNFALERAAGWAEELGKPLLVLEALRAGHRWASVRFHRFVLEGMADNAATCVRRRVTYYPYLEPEPGAGHGLLAALAERAAVVITDDYPCFFLPRMVAAAGTQLNRRLERVDSNGLLPLRAADTVFPSAYAFRRFLHKNLAPHLAELPRAQPLRRRLPGPAAVPEAITRRWPPLDPGFLSGDGLASLPIDHAVGAVETHGGTAAATRALSRFIARRLDEYGERRNEPDEDWASGLSPYLHWGHISVHQVFSAVAERDQWTPECLAAKATGKRSGWWGMTPEAESFLDECITWRELGFNFTSKRHDYDRYSSLPEWAQKTLAKHARDPRAHSYALADFEAARTHDPLWNAAQRQLLREGRIHNYLRMLWGKKILEWTASPEEALTVMIELNNKYALDGRDPNSYTGIFWVLGRYDRPWGPERPIFGHVRYMTSENTARKMSVKGYLARYASAEEDAGPQPSGRKR